ncbi:unnamed protein product [Sphagnum jensenii]|uniref:Plant synaptotagmin n=1 Tax=Sphagnum jensenii TaxID=128206 RepID=A0ABP1B3A5_9BRYO
MVRGTVGGAAREAQHMWSQLVHEKSVLPYLIPVFVLAWLLERWVIPLSSWIPVIISVWAALQYENFQLQQTVENLNNQWRRHILCSQPNTPLEPSEWLNKMLTNVWPNFVEPKLVHKLMISVAKRIKDKKPRPIQSMVLNDFSLGTTPPVFGLQRTYWSTEGDQAVLHMGFEWDTKDMSLLLAAKLGGPLRGKVARIDINSLHIKGDLRILPILDGQGMLFSFERTPAVKVGIVFGSGSHSVPQTELPLVAGWLEKLFIDTVNRTMVEPNRRCYGLPAVNLKKHAVGGIISVTVVSAHGLTRIRHEDSRGESRSSGSSSGHGSSHHTSSNNGGGGSHNGRVRKKFVEIACEDLTRKTHLQDGGTSPVWNETIDMVLHDNTGTVHLNVYEQGHNNVKYDFLGSCEIKMKYIDDDSTIFWAVGPNSGVLAMRAEHCGKEVTMTVPLENTAAGELTVRLELKEWQFSDGSRAVANHLPGTFTLNSVPSLNPYTGRKLRISAVEGRNLAPVSTDGSINPYLKLFYAKLVRKTKIVNQATNPIWNQGFPFQEVAGEYLKIKCYNSDSFGDENMGSARVNLQAIEDGTVQDVWVPLEKTQQGEIHLKIETEYTEENGSMSATEGAIVELVIVEARDLIAADWGGTSDPYVSVRYGNIKKHTKVVYKTLAPQWQQTLEFMDDRSPLVLHVKDYNAIFPTSSIGHCDVEYEHLHSNQTIDRWIPLQGVRKGEIHIQLTRRVAEKQTEVVDVPELQKSIDSPMKNIRLQQTTGKVQALIRKALTLAEEEEEMEEIRSMLEELENAQEEREGVITKLQKDRNLLVTKVRELEQAMSGFV